MPEETPNNSKEVANLQSMVGTHLNHMGERLIAPALENGLSSAISTQLTQSNNETPNLPQQKPRPQSPQNGPSEFTPSEEDVKNSIKNLKEVLQKYVVN